MKQQGDCYDNAMMESLWATLKKEGLKFGISAKGRTARLLSHGYLSPEQFEAAKRVGSYECVSTESGRVQDLKGNFSRITMDFAPDGLDCA